MCIRDSGYITPYMVTDNEKMEAVIDDAYILITDKKISNIQEILLSLIHISRPARSWLAAPNRAQMAVTLA